MKTSVRSLSTAICFGALLAAPCAGSATTASSTMSVSATVVNTCTVAVLPLLFGVYTVTNAQPTEAQSTVETLCTIGDPVTISMDAGANSKTFAGREMAFGGTYLPYQIFTDAGYSKIWGDGVTGGSNTVTTTGTGVLTSTDVYGQIPVGKNVPSGAYTDAVVVTISY